MSRLVQNIHNYKFKDLKRCVHPDGNYFTKNGHASYFTRKVSDELRNRGYKVSLKYGTVDRKLVSGLSTTTLKRYFKGLVYSDYHPDTIAKELRKRGYHASLTYRELWR